jgi:hypothetical protein
MSTHQNSLYKQILYKTCTYIFIKKNPGTSPRYIINLGRLFHDFIKNLQGRKLGLQNRTFLFLQNFIEHQYEKSCTNSCFNQTYLIFVIVQKYLANSYFLHSRIYLNWHNLCKRISRN